MAEISRKNARGHGAAQVNKGGQACLDLGREPWGALGLAQVVFRMSDLAAGLLIQYAPCDVRMSTQRPHLIVPPTEQTSRTFCGEIPIRRAGASSRYIGFQERIQGCL